MAKFGPALGQYVSFASYGNDSVALIQLCRELGLENVTTLYSSTGWAKDEWAARIERCEEWVRSIGYTPMRTQSEGMEALVERKKAWPRQGMQFCTEELKIKPVLTWLDEIDPIGLAWCLVGVRREESTVRRAFPEHMTRSFNHGGRHAWAPLVDYQEIDRDALIRRAGFEPLPHRSRECWPCVNENKKGILQLDEPTIQKVERIETAMGFTGKGKPRTMFRPAKHMGATGIRQIVKWAASGHGQFSLDDGTGEDCDTGFCGV